jgi:hypothetical protein
MLKNNLIFILVNNNSLGFLDTGGGTTFLFRKPELSIELDYPYINNNSLDFLPKNVILFCGNDYWANSIYLFDYINKKFKFIYKIPKNVTSYKMLNNKINYCLFEILFENKKEIFLFDTGAALIRNNKNYGVSFLDGKIFDKLKDKYKIIEKYDDDGSPCIIIPEIIVFNTVIKNVKFIRRKKNAFLQFMTKQTGIKHIGAIGGNVLKYFRIICDFKNKMIYL